MSCHAFNYAPGEELRATHTRGEGEVSHHNNSSDHKYFSHIWKEKKKPGHVVAQIDYFSGSDQRMLHNKNSNLLFGLFFSPPVY